MLCWRTSVSRTRVLCAAAAPEPLSKARSLARVDKGRHGRTGDEQKHCSLRDDACLKSCTWSAVCD
eukprot:6214739-Pleurochrysis_carterae.AAC.4